MEGLKNIVVLKNLPSNIIDEAIVVVKSSVKLKSKVQSENVSKKHNYVVKEAEGIIKNYLKNIEDEKVKDRIKIIESKYRKLKKVTAILCIMLVISGIINIF